MPESNDESSKEQDSNKQLYDQLMRERYGDLRALARERITSTYQQRGKK